MLSADKKEINNNALNFYCNFGRNDDVETIFKGIYKLLPGEIIIWKNNNIEKKKILQLKKSKKIFENKNLKQLIEESISSQLVSDVPLALSLSGGVDSNIVYSVMRKKLVILTYILFILEIMKNLMKILK